MFRRLLKSWPDARITAPHFVHYLERHIELDGDHHLVLAKELLAALGSTVDSRGWRLPQDAAGRAIVAHLALWDAVRTGHESPRAASGV